MTTLDDKTYLASCYVKNAIDRFGSDCCAVACSFGKDSMVVLHLALQHDPNIPVVWCDTKCENKLTYDFQRKITKEWDLNLHIARAPKGVNFWSIVKEYGLPHVRGEGKNREPKCCDILKNEPSKEKYEELGTRLIMRGVTSAESRQRFMLHARYSNEAQRNGILLDDLEGYGSGCRYTRKTDGMEILHPIAHWTVNDVFEYHEAKKIPLCGVYDLCKGARVGCDPCTAYNSFIKRMPLQSPESFSRIRKMLGITSLDDFGGA